MHDEHGQAPADSAAAGNTRSCDERTEGIREYKRLIEILQRTGAALGSNLEHSAIVQVLTDAATELSGAQFGAFFYNVTNEQGEAYMLYTLSGVERSAFERFPMPRATAIFGPTFRGEGILRADDILKHPSYGKSAPYRGMPPGHLPVRSYLALPVKSRSGEVHGGLFLGHGEPARFTETHETLLSGIAAQAAIAIDNARLIEEAREARGELEKLNKELAGKVHARTAELHESEQQFRQLILGVEDCAIFMIDVNGFVTSWNVGAERIKGYTSDEIIGQHFSVFYTLEDREKHLPELVLDAARIRGKYEAEGWRVRKDGTRFWANVLIDAIRNDEGDLIGFAKITRDMTERRAIQEQLQQSQKMEAIGQLTGGVAHDFNNLLTIILGNLETLSRHMRTDDARARHLVEQAARGAQRAATLTSQLLAFSRRQPLNPKSTDINRLIGGTSELIRRTLGENVAIETVLGAGVWRADVDANQLENALLNLAVNARDAMPNGGKLTIETANAHIDERYAAEYAEISPGQYVLISVTDTGLGMTAEVMAKAFDPFFTTKPLGQGTGLGLSQVFGFVKQSGGHIKLYSEVNEGTTVKIYLPRSAAQPELLDEDQLTSESRGYPGETVLVVEDDEGVRMYSVESLRELGFTVLEAPDALTALRILDHHPEVNLLFTDVGLPGLNGRELVDRASERRPGLRVLFTTGYARNAIVHQGRLDPGVELLTKPFTRAQLGARIRAVLDTAAPGSGERVALLVEDEPLVRMYLAESMTNFGFAVLQAASAREALALAERNPNIALAIVDVGLPDRNGLDVVADLLSRSSQMCIAIASGYGRQALGRFTGERRVTLLAKPFDSEGIAAALRTLGVISAACSQSDVI